MKSGYDMKMDPWHPLTCQAERGRSQTTRHHEITNFIKRFAQYSDVLSISLEPRVNETFQNRADLSLQFPDKKDLIDVSIVHPTAPSNRHRLEHPLAVANAAYKEKMKKYHQAGLPPNTEIIPFICQTNGGIHQYASTYIATLLPEQSEVSFKLFPHTTLRNRFFYELAVALQKANTRCADNAFIEIRKTIA